MRKIVKIMVKIAESNLEILMLKKLMKCKSPKFSLKLRQGQLDGHPCHVLLGEKQVSINIIFL